jgi:hypothetical protein
MVQVQLDDHVADALSKQPESRRLRLSDYRGLEAASQAQSVAPVISADEIDHLIEDEADDEVALGATLSRTEIYRG